MHVTRAPAPVALLGFVAILLGLSSGSAHAQAAQAVVSQYTHADDAPVAQAVRTSVSLSVDGRLDEAVWMTAPVADGFRQTLPNEGQPVTQKTEIRFLYDDENIYVGAWLWDTGQVLTRLARRDVGVPDADFFVILFDSYHDHRTAYRFATSPSAMKRDEITTGDGGNGSFGDTSWDPVWDVASTTTEEGWFVEMRIPFSQLRYSREEVQEWGVQVERKIRRHGEDTVWAFTPRSERGGISRYGHLTGITGIAQGKRLELLPFIGGRAEFTNVPRNTSVAFDNPFRSGSDFFSNAGLDLKYRLTSNLTLDATVNPDFGQVELDPAVINLSAFETRFDEKRPFFIEGAEIFDFGSGGQLLYSRRIGRAPQGSVGPTASYSNIPTASTILGALKLTGKSSNGLSIGVLNAVTDREHAPFVDADGDEAEAVVEPLTNHFAARIRRDLDAGRISFGAIGTAVHRKLDEPFLVSRLRSAAYTGGVDSEIEFAERTWTASGALSSSYIRGDQSAINLAQRSSARYLQRPDADHLTYDPTATSLTGLNASAGVSKRAGDWRGGSSFSFVSPGYEVNDLGFQAAADRIDLDANWGYQETAPGPLFRSWSYNVAPSATWNTAGEAQALEVGASANIQLLSFHGGNVRISRQFEANDDRFTRGGPNAEAPAGYSGNIGINTDGRKPFQLRTSLGFSEDDAGGWSRSANFNVTMRFQGIYEFTMGPDLRRTRAAAQYVTTRADALATNTFNSRYIFAPLDQTTLSLTTRFNATFTPNLSFELYAQPFISSGDYGNFMEFTAPGTFDFAEYGVDRGTVRQNGIGRVAIDPDGTGPANEFNLNEQDFNVRSLLGNAVVRWEWRAGSTLFLVWQQSRSDRLTLAGDTQQRRVGRFEFDADTRALFDMKPDNIFLIKLNYWLNP